MFFPITFKIFFSITLIMTAAAGINTYFTMGDVGNAMLVSPRDAGEKMLEHVWLNTQEEDRNLLRAKKTDMALEKGSKLKEAGRLVLSRVKHYASTVSLFDDIGMPMIRYNG